MKRLLVGLGGWMQLGNGDGYWRIGMDCLCWMAWVTEDDEQSLEETSIVCIYEVCPDDFRKIAIKKNSYSCDILYF